MMMDIQTNFENALALSSLAVATTVSTNTIDLLGGSVATIPQGGSAPVDFGKGRPMEVFAAVGTAATSGGAATMTVQLITSAAANLSSPTVLCSTAAIAVTSMVSGYQFRFGSIPPGITQRYLGIQFIVGTAVFTAGTLTAGLVLDKQTAFTVG